MRMMVVVVGVSALMGWQGIPLRLAALAAVPLALCEGGGQPRGLPLQGFAPPLSLRDISPASGGSEILPINAETPNNHNPSFASFKNHSHHGSKSPFAKRKGGAMRSERGMQCHAISADIPNNNAPNPSHHSKIIPIMVQKQEWIPASAGMT